MQTGDISFCGKTAQNIKSEDTKKEILQNIEERYHERILKRHFDSFGHPRSVDRINTSPHVVCLKTNGNPYLLYLTQIGFTRIALFIDRKISSGYILPRVILSRLCFDEDLFDGTLFQGEMIKQKDQSWVYMISDLIALRGRHLGGVHLFERLQSLGNVLANHWKPHPLDMFSIEIKRYVRYSELRNLVKELDSLPYTCRGVLFKPMYLNQRDILYNFDDSAVVSAQKIKYGNNNFIDPNTKPTLTQAKHTHAQTKVQPQPQPQTQPQTQMQIQPQTQPQTQMQIQPQPQPQIQMQSRMVLALERAGDVDVYTAYDPKTSKSEGMVCVNTIKLSHMLQDAFDGAPVNERIRFVCEWSDRFKKWKPVSRATDA